MQNVTLDFELSDHEPALSLALNSSDSTYIL